METTKNENLDDISIPKDRENYDKMVEYLVSMPVSNYDNNMFRLSGESNIKHESEQFTLLLEEILNLLFFSDNVKKAKNIIKYRATIEKSEAVDGFSRIYELNNEKILLMEIDGSFVSVAATIHELTHLLQAINENNPSKKYNEILSMEDGKLVYDPEKVSDKQKEWLEEMDIQARQDIIPIYTAEQLKKIRKW